MANLNNFNVRNDLWDNVTPNYRVQGDIQVPQGDKRGNLEGGWQPAKWLPVAFTQSNYLAGEDAFVISSGKVVAMDAEGKLVPAGMRANLIGAAVGDTVITYTATDVKWGVVDFTTGERLTAPKTVTSLQFAQAIVARGYVDRTAAIATVADVTAVIEAFISLPVGIASYNFYVYSGAPERGDQHFTNYSKQYNVQFYTEMEMRMPHMADATTVDDTIADVELVVLNDAPTYGQRPADLDVLSATGAGLLGRWDAADVGDVVVVTLSEFNVAAETERTPVSCDVPGVLVSAKGSIDQVSAEGDYYLDHKAGYLVISRAAWDTMVANTTDPTFSYYVYGAGSTAGSEQYVYFNGPVNFGDRLVSCDAASNFCQKGSAVDILPTEAPALGQLISLNAQPMGLLAATKTAWENPNFTSASKMPGSATKGFTSHITLANEPVADTLAIVKVRI